MTNNRLLAAVLISAATMVSSPVMATTTIDFEGYASGTTITNQYADKGVTFNGASILKSPGYNYTQYPPHSGLDVIYNPAGDIVLTFSSLVSDLSAYASTSTPLTLSAFAADGSLLGTSTLMANLYSSSLISFSGTGIASARFSSSSPASRALDDISFTPVVTGAVPEPATWAMMFLGLGAVGFAMRRRVRASEVKFNTKIKQIAEGATA